MPAYKMETPGKKARWLMSLAHPKVPEPVASALYPKLEANGFTPTKVISLLKLMETDNPKQFERICIRLGHESEGALIHIMDAPPKAAAAAAGSESRTDGQPQPKRHCANGAPVSASADGMRYLPGHVPAGPSPGSSSAAAAGGSSGTTIPRKTAVTEQAVEIGSSSGSEADDESDEDSEPVAKRSRKRQPLFGADPGDPNGTPAQQLVSKRHWRKVKSRYSRKLFKPVTKAIATCCNDMIEICRKKTEIFGQVHYNSLLLVPPSFREDAIEDMLVLVTDLINAPPDCIDAVKLKYTDQLLNKWSNMKRAGELKKIPQAAKDAAMAKYKALYPNWAQLIADHEREEAEGKASISAAAATQSSAAAADAAATAAAARETADNVYRAAQTASEQGLTVEAQTEVPDADLATSMPGMQALTAPDLVPSAALAAQPVLDLAALGLSAVAGAPTTQATATGLTAAASADGSLHSVPVDLFAAAGGALPAAPNAAVAMSAEQQGTTQVPAVEEGGRARRPSPIAQDVLDLAGEVAAAKVAAADEQTVKDAAKEVKKQDKVQAIAEAALLLNLKGPGGPFGDLAQANWKPKAVVGASAPADESRDRGGDSAYGKPLVKETKRERLARLDKEAEAELLSDSEGGEASERSKKQKKKPSAAKPRTQAPRSKKNGLSETTPSTAAVRGSPQSKNGMKRLQNAKSEDQKKLEREERGVISKQANGGQKGAKQARGEKLAAGGKTKSISDLYQGGTQTERVCETDVEEWEV